MDVDDNNTDYDRESDGMNCEEEQDDNSQYSYNDDDERYDYEDDDVGGGQTYLKAYAGMQFDGNMNEMMKAPGKSSLYPVYKQLSEICLVDINPDFFSATLTAGVKDQVVMASITFPRVAPFFPNAPPKLEIQSKFRYPNEKYNILFNCHPQLLGTQWNFCTDIVQIVRDLIQTVDSCVVDTFDDDYEDGKGVQRMIIKMVHQNSLDVTSLFPDSQVNKLPSFGIIREPIAAAVTAHGTRPRGVGYSSDGYSRHELVAEQWSVSAYTTARLDGLLDLTKKVQADIVAAKKRGAEIDPMMIDAVYFIFSHTISRTITVEEFFRNLAFYDRVVECLLPLPPPSEHIAPVQSLLKLYETVAHGRLSEALEPNEKEVVSKLRVLYDRLERPAEAAAVTLADAKPDTTSSSSSSGGCGAKGEAPVAEDGSARFTRSSAASASKKRQLSGADDSTADADTKDTTPAPTSSSSRQGGVGGTSSNTSTPGKAGAGADSFVPMIPLAEIPRVVESEDPFVAHKYASDMKGVSRMSAKWMRRVNMELVSMPESLPDNVIVFSGMLCSQPNLMKILMFPESPDTPYCGGCFVFDAFLPSDYPANPPKVNLITTGSGTVRFNPNLYNCGKVCLSLLGTWSGEKWNPEVSSMSQVINSILFLIFVEHPYFNEPGYQSSQGTASGDRHSEQYNVAIRAATLQFGYLDHLKKPHPQLGPYILPMLCRNWRVKGRATALKWATAQATLLPVIDAIEAEVTRLVGPAAAEEEAAAAAVSGEKACPAARATAGAK